MSGALKRKFDEVEEDPCYSSASASPASPSSSAFSEWESDGESCFSDTLDSRPSCPGSPAAPPLPASILKKGKRARKGGVRFDGVTVFFFPRCQGFTSVPSRGGCTLGMARWHSARRYYTLAEFALQQRQLRRDKLRERLREEKLEALRLKLTNNGTQELEEADRLTLDDIPEEEVDISGVDLDDGSFLHPYPSRRRHALLKAAGVKKIDKDEKRQLQELRRSREDCGCDCQGFCEPETCACSLAGIKCQMDHSSFPCGCTRDGCGNTEGRIEFNSSRVQTHYIHTIMKLELEKRLEESLEEAVQQHPLQEQACATPSFHFSPELAAAGDSSCSSDITDSSCSSGQSEDSADRPRPGPAPLEVDDDGLARILSLSAADSEGSEDSEDGSCSSGGNRQQEPADLTTMDSHFSNGAGFAPPGRSASISSYLDENANQADTLFRGFPGATSPPAEPPSKSYTDLSLSSDSDFEFFDSFPDYSPSSLYSSLRDYDHLDSFFHFQLPSYPSLPHTSESGTCLLESLIGLSESVPEPPATFTDNQLLEEAIKSSMVESVRV
ncbi:cysteine/serine-rich nuclear protein 1-like [Megalops cyprinoides]|uniref:cysteine/serine-rich nuclear protein 1-like n=1 Tax=Megalops cyprinoides TaxID=118141 RepID=UPI0018648201|nr:cysteine/serine-rich nuclear protein 1-like [Megalops cyprinoides]XP_036375133.1 cysteine/serine-rich nuclear protein 1-like [Megalops cyprinoides]